MGESEQGESSANSLPLGFSRELPGWYSSVAQLKEAPLSLSLSHVCVLHSRLKMMCVRWLLVAMMAYVCVPGFGSVYLNSSVCNNLSTERRIQVSPAPFMMSLGKETLNRAAHFIHGSMCFKEDTATTAEKTHFELDCVDS